MFPLLSEGCNSLWKQGSISARGVSPRSHQYHHTKETISQMLLLLLSPPQRKQLKQHLVCAVNRDPVVVTERQDWSKMCAQCTGPDMWLGSWGEVHLTISDYPTRKSCLEHRRALHQLQSTAFWQISIDGTKKPWNDREEQSLKLIE